MFAIVVLVSYTRGIALVKGYIDCNQVGILVSYKHGIALVNNGYGSNKEAGQLVPSRLNTSAVFTLLVEVYWTNNRFPTTALSSTYTFSDSSAMDSDLFGFDANVYSFIGATFSLPVFLSTTRVSSFMFVA